VPFETLASEENSDRTFECDEDEDSREVLKIKDYVCQHPGCGKIFLEQSLLDKHVEELHMLQVLAAVATKNDGNQG